MKAAILCLAAVFVIGHGAAPANAQSSVNRLDDFVERNAKPNAPLTLEQDQVLSKLREELGNRSLFAIAADAGIFVAEGRGLSVKPIADWTQGDFRRFAREAPRAERRINEIVLGYFFEEFLGGDGGGDSGGDGAE